MACASRGYSLDRPARETVDDAPALHDERVLTRVLRVGDELLGQVDQVQGAAPGLHGVEQDRLQLATRRVELDPVESRQCALEFVRPQVHPQQQVARHVHPLSGSRSHRAPLLARGPGGLVAGDVEVGEALGDERGGEIAATSSRARSSSSCRSRGSLA